MDEFPLITEQVLAEVNRPQWKWYLTGFYSEHSWTKVLSTQTCAYCFLSGWLLSLMETALMLHWFYSYAIKRLPQRYRWRYISNCFHALFSWVLAFFKWKGCKNKCIKRASRAHTNYLLYQTSKQSGQLSLSAVLWYVYLRVSESRCYLPSSLESWWFIPLKLCLPHSLCAHTPYLPISRQERRTNMI